MDMVYNTTNLNVEHFDWKLPIDKNSNITRGPSGLYRSPEFQYENGSQEEDFWSHFPI